MMGFHISLRQAAQALIPLPTSADPLRSTGVLPSALASRAQVSRHVRDTFQPLAIAFPFIWDYSP